MEFVVVGSVILAFVIVVSYRKDRASNKLNSANNEKFATLYKLIDEGDVQGVKSILSTGIEINDWRSVRVNGYPGNGYGCLGRPPLAAVAVSRTSSLIKVKVAKYLLQAGANINDDCSHPAIEYPSLSTPLSGACFEAEYELAKLYLENGANPNVLISNKLLANESKPNNAMQGALYHDSEDILQLLLDYECSTDNAYAYAIGRAPKCAQVLQKHRVTS
ncbi:hypothetical protein [Alteromonas macleodii]|uniref:hypothetical protein n=1 Tax=Alteromonas macleodii TaxID=28108 RepID=UPI0022AF4B71|nr:hypothetical protein [Alteromonas macleodii]MCZ4240469.1 hypothetical protein [Alteromonas macleodii]